MTWTEDGLPEGMKTSNGWAWFTAGSIALTLASRRPDLVDALGLLATNAFTDTPIPSPLSLATAPLIGPLARRGLFSGPSLRMMLRQGVGRDSTRPDPRTHLGDRNQQCAIATIFAGSLTGLAEPYAPVEAALARVSVPAFVGWGDRDPLFQLAQGERTATAMGVELRVYEGVVHFLPHERPHEVATDIVALVARSSQARRDPAAGTLARRVTGAHGGLDAWQRSSAHTCTSRPERADLSPSRLASAREFGVVGASAVREAQRTDCSRDHRDRAAGPT